jgi:flagellum-specific ATP synthase
LSRAASGCLSAEEIDQVRRARQVLALQGEMADLVRLGAYRAGADPAVDEALRLAPRLETMLRQQRDERSNIAESFALLRDALRDPAAVGDSLDGR